MLSFPISLSWAKLSSFQTWEILMVEENYFISHNALPSMVKQWSCLPITEWINKSIKYSNFLDSLGSHWCKINGILNGFKEIKYSCFFSIHYSVVAISRNHKTVYMCNLIHLSIYFWSYYMKNLGCEHILPISSRSCVKYNMQLCDLQG